MTNEESDWLNKLIAELSNKSVDTFSNFASTLLNKGYDEEEASAEISSFKIANNTWSIISNLNIINEYDSYIQNGSDIFFSAYCLQEFLKIFRPAKAIIFSSSNSCSQTDVDDGFGGANLLVTGDFIFEEEYNLLTLQDNYEESREDKKLKITMMATMTKSPFVEED